MTNLLAPLLFSEGEIDLFLRDHVCGLCRRDYRKKFAPGRQYTAECIEHGLALAHQPVSRWAAEQAEQNELAALRELRP